MDLLEIYGKRNKKRYMAKKIAALIVLYEPEKESFTLTYNALALQVDGFCIVDNSKENHNRWFDNSNNVIYIPLQENAGIASAQNIGIKALMKAGYEMILFSDQDSIASPDLVEKLYSAHNLLKSNDIPIATLGCYAVDKATGIQYSSKNIIKKETINIEGRKFTVVDYLRCSMTLTDIRVLNEVGGMDETLFIDGVDCEWCWRAFDKNNKKTILVEDAFIYHSIGHGSHKVINRLVTIPSSFRLFYQYRNYLWLIRRNYVPMRWKVRNGFKYIVKIPYYSLFCSPRVKNLKNIVNGIIAGI